MSATSGMMNLSLPFTTVLPSLGTCLASVAVGSDDDELDPPVAPAAALRRVAREGVTIRVARGGKTIRVHAVSDEVPDHGGRPSRRQLPVGREPSAHGNVVGVAFDLNRISDG